METLIIVLTIISSLAALIFAAHLIYKTRSRNEKAFVRKRRERRIDVKSTAEYEIITITYKKNLGEISSSPKKGKSRLVKSKPIWRAFYINNKLVFENLPKNVEIKDSGSTPIKVQQE